MAFQFGLVGESLPAVAADERPLVVREVRVDLVRRQLLFLDAGLAADVAGRALGVFEPRVSAEIVRASYGLVKKNHFEALGNGSARSLN